MGHFPKARRKLLDLLEKHRPQGLLISSGDVHYAEFAGVSTSSSNPAVLEVTSSGLTHTCYDLAGSLCDLVLHYFSGHRPRSDDFYLGVNFGSLHFNWQAVNGPEVQVYIHDAHGRVVLRHSLALQKPSLGTVELPGLAYGFGRKFLCALFVMPVF